MFSRDRKKASEWTNLAKVLDFGLPEGVYRYVEWLSLFIAKSINFKDFLEKSLLSFCILHFAFCIYGRARRPSPTIGLEFFNIPYNIEYTIGKVITERILEIRT